MRRRIVDAGPTVYNIIPNIILGTDGVVNEREMMKSEELRCPACGAIAEEHLFTSFSGDKDWRCPEPEAMIENATDEEYQSADSIDLSADEYPYRDSVSDEKPSTFEEMIEAFFERNSDWYTNLLQMPIHVSESWPKDTIGFFNPANIKVFIDEANQLWAKSDKGDELIIEPYHFQQPFQQPVGPCSCLTHRTENCSECFSGLRSQEFIATVRVKYNEEAAGDFDDSIRYLIEGLYDYRGVTHVDAEVNKVIPSPNPSFAWSDVGPSDLPRVPSVPKAYMAFPAGMNPLTNSSNVTVSVSTPFEPTPEQLSQFYREMEDEMIRDRPERLDAFRTYYGADGPSDNEAGPNPYYEDFEVLGQMTVDEMMASITDITETIYPNQSASLLPKFELVIRALYENAGDAVNIG